MRNDIFEDVESLKNSNNPSPEKIEHIIIRLDAFAFALAFAADLAKYSRDKLNLESKQYALYRDDLKKQLEAKK